MCMTATSASDLKRDEHKKLITFNIQWSAKIVPPTVQQLNDVTSKLDIEKFADKSRLMININGQEYLITTKYSELITNLASPENVSDFIAKLSTSWGIKDDYITLYDFKHTRNMQYLKSVQTYMNNKSLTSHIENIMFRKALKSSWLYDNIRFEYEAVDADDVYRTVYLTLALPKPINDHLYVRDDNDREACYHSQNLIIIPNKIGTLTEALTRTIYNNPQIQHQIGVKAFFSLPQDIFIKSLDKTQFSDYQTRIKRFALKSTD